MPGDDLLPKGDHTDFAPSSAEHKNAMKGVAAKLGKRKKNPSTGPNEPKQGSVADAVGFFSGLKK